MQEADTKHAYVVDDTGVSAFCGTNECEKLISLEKGDEIIDLKTTGDIYYYAMPVDEE